MTYLDLIDGARCSPNSRRQQRQSYQWLANRYKQYTGKTITAAAVKRLEDKFYEQQRSWRARL